MRRIPFGPTPPRLVRVNLADRLEHIEVSNRPGNDLPHPARGVRAGPASEPARAVQA
jgi:hypothetical protein